MASLFPFPLRRSTTRAAAALLAMAAMAAIADGAFAQSADSGTPTRTSLTVIDGGTVSGTPILVAAGPEQSEKRPLAAFRSIHISVPADSTFTVSATPSIVVTTQANVLPVVETQVEGDRLVVRIKGAVQLQHAVKLEISGPSPESITLSGTGSLHAQDLKSPDLALNISGMATLTAAGDVRHVSASISGTGSIDTTSIHASSLDARISGEGSLRAFASESARIRLSGIGNVHVAGQPAQRSVERSGLGSATFD